jgi:hypothetical protein
MKSWGMGAVAAAVVVVWMGGTARADYCPTEIFWPGWRVTSSEDLYLGARHTSYPLTNLFDGRADTAWVPSGKGKSPIYKDRTVLVLAPEKPIRITSLRLMTGYNKSEELFAKNDRAAEISITVNGRNYLGIGMDPEQRPFTKTTRLKDSMGWHSVALDGRKVETLTIEITDRHKGTTGDLCLSELELYDGDRKIDMHMPEVVRFTEGDECGCGLVYTMIRRDGTRLGAGGQEGFEGASNNSGAWSPSGRYWAAVDFNEKTHKGFLYVVDATTGRIVFRRTTQAFGRDVTWKGDEFVRVTWHPEDTSSKSPPPLTYKVPPQVPAAKA